jgi:hypothetical protein
VHETEAEIRELQALLDRSSETAGPHLRRIFRPPEHSLSAAELGRFFVGPRQIAVATVTKRGEPRVAPVDGLLLHGRFHFGTHSTAARIRHLRARPSISLTYFERDEIAIVVHGRATLVEFGQPGFAEIDAEFLSVYGGTPSTEDEGSFFVRVDPAAVYTYVRDPGRLPGPRPQAS